MLHRSGAYRMLVGYICLASEYIMSLQTGTKATHFDITVKLALKKKRKTGRVKRKFNNADLWMHKNNILQNTA